MRIGYFPGCALHGSSNDYEQSVRAIFAQLDVELAELTDWICCGATAAHSINEKLSKALPARNLAIAERDGHGEVLAPCPLCSMEFCKSRAALLSSPELRREMSEIVELPVTGSTEVVNLIQVIQRVGVPEIAARATRSLSDFKPACYYGCMLTRPRRIVAFDDPEHPSSMEDVLAALGAEPVDWNYKTECCGAGMTMADEDTVVMLAHRILTNAKEHGANCVVVACPMCHVNLDMKQPRIEHVLQVTHGMPVYYLSDLVGLALGIDESTLGIDRHFVSAASTVLSSPAPDPSSPVLADSGGE